MVTQSPILHTKLVNNNSACPITVHAAYTSTRVLSPYRSLHFGHVLPLSFIGRTVRRCSYELLLTTSFLPTFPTRRVRATEHTIRLPNHGCFGYQWLGRSEAIRVAQFPVYKEFSSSPSPPPLTNHLEITTNLLTSCRSDTTIKQPRSGTLSRASRINPLALPT